MELKFVHYSFPEHLPGLLIAPLMELKFRLRLYNHPL